MKLYIYIYEKKNKNKIYEKKKIIYIYLKTVYIKNTHKKEKLFFCYSFDQTCNLG